MAPLRRNRRWGSMKGERELRMQVPPEIFAFFDARSINKNGQRRSRGQTLELLVQLALHLENPADINKSHEVCKDLLDEICAYASGRIDTEQ